MDILIPLGKGSKWQNNELRYCLRSIERYATGYDRIFVIGEDPGFLNCRASVSDASIVFHPRREIDANKEARIAHKILWAFQHTDINDDVVLFNDDYVLVGATDLSRLPFYHRGELAGAAARQSCPLYRHAITDTIKVLTAAGKSTLHYDIHVPMILNRQKFVVLSEWWNRSAKTWQGFLVKSVYANNTSSNSHLPSPISVFIHDCKLRHAYPARIVDSFAQRRFVFSYSDAGLSPVLKQWLADKFPEPSKFESCCRRPMGDALASHSEAATTLVEDVDRLRKWGKGRARPVSTLKPEVVVTGRKIA